MSSESTSSPTEPEPKGTGTFVGIDPWLPWPLSAWSWWTTPVRAERLAAWRIAVALCLIVDLLINYVPETIAYFGKAGLGDPANFDWRFASHRTTWSLLRGVGDSANFYISLTIWIAASGWILGNSAVWLVLMKRNAPRPDRTGAALWIWTAAYTWHVAGQWAHQLEVGKFDTLAWLTPLVGFSLVCLFHALDIAARLRDEEHRISWLGLLTLPLTGAMTGVGFMLTLVEKVEPDAWWAPILRSWQDNETLLWLAMFAYLASAVLLLFGFATRWAAVTAWLLAMSFGNANPYLDNAGDTIRVILLMYLMLCPCGAVWSIDALWRPRRSPVFVSPWPIRLMFIQMIFIYFMNGSYKLMGEHWVDGDSLHYVLGDVVLTRFSPMMIELPIWLSKLMTWTVVAWEVLFPVLVVWKWSRRAALLFGVLFHLGIFVTMELGGFVPYALCMYVPLLAWGGWASEADAQKEKAGPDGPA